MAAIVRAVCKNDSSGDSNSHRVKVTCEGVFKDLEIDSVNGLYLRKDDEVYVYTSDDTWYDALILGRCNGQLELQNLVDVLNDIIDKQKEIIDSLTEHKNKYDVHTHGNLVGTFEGTIAGSPATGTVTGTMASPAPEQAFPQSPDKLDNIDCDDLLHE